MLSNLLIAGVLMSHPNWALAQDTLLTQEYLSRTMSDARKRYKVPAIAVTVMNSKSLLLQEVQGVKVIDKQAQATLDDYFHIGSCSKSVLAVMAAKLIEQKKITWQTRFFDVFPELKASANSAYHDISLEDLFLGEAGIKAYTDMDAEPLPEYGPSIGDKRLEFVKHLIAQPPSSKKKDGRFQHFYSNAGYTMASAMLERVSGDTYEKLVKKTVTDGLGMSVHIGWPNSTSLTVSPRAHLAVLEETAREGIVGGSVYDALIAEVARRAGATLLTRDRRAVLVYERIGADYEIIG